MQLIVRSLTSHVLDVSPDANVEVAVLVFIFISIMLYQCCVSGMFIPDPDFYPFRISDPGSKNSNKREG
jgi:hypothetical protein